MKFLLNLLGGFAFLTASTGSSACVAFWIDEPKCPKSLIK